MDKFLLEVISHFEIGKPTSINSITWEGWSSNKLYRVTTAKGTYVLKSKTSAQASENLTKATVIRQFLIDSGLETIPKPIPTHDLSLTYTDLNNICWELQECIEGINVDPENITRKHCESLATEIANYHKLFLNNEKLAKNFHQFSCSFLKQINF